MRDTTIAEGPTWRSESHTLSGRSALILGGTDGIGKAVAMELAGRGAQVTIVGSQTAKGLAAEREVREITDNSDVQFFQADLGLMRETGRLADRIMAERDALHYLVHSAGIVRGRWTLTEEGIESNFAVNYLSRFLLTNRLLPLLEAGSRDGRCARIVIHGGGLENGTIHFQNLNLSARFTTLRAISQFCRANDLFTIELGRRMASTLRISINNLKLGPVKTNIRKEFPLWMRIAVPLLADPLLGQAPETVARYSARLLVDTEFEGVTGELFKMIKRFKRLPSQNSSRNREEAKKLWRVSQQLLERLDERITNHLLTSQTNITYEL
jgi:NAD(P)-dependent dehydrogenase (short-subunit alcohol dehydrogenase family)